MRIDQYFGRKWGICKQDEVTDRKTYGPWLMLMQDSPLRD